ncbi:hypothetical protein CYY_005451 [Polysphondylium violaceum]|uniref:Pleckstrin domain-containing protein n=1 Tax=Polysphondylium violaceum TaxID=133409 RepID=A0A8J4PWD6_9MYCE|nr:hypothetical protein CYY_005451 [Polysphondylium violaceum]
MNNDEQDSSSSRIPMISVSNLSQLSLNGCQGSDDDSSVQNNNSISSNTSHRYKSILLNKNGSTRSVNNSGGSLNGSTSSPKKFSIKNIGASVTMANFTGLFSKQTSSKDNHHHHSSFSDFTGKVFNSKGVKKLRNISRRRRQRKKSKDYALRRKISQLMNSRWAMIVMVIATLFLLYIDDLMLATLAPDNTVSYAIISSLKILVFIIFAIDIIFSIYVQRLNYVLTLFFPIDLISIASLIPDIIAFIFGITSIAHAINALSLSRTARVARMASRISRMAKIINFFNVFMCADRVSTKNKHELQLHTEPSSIGKKLLGKTSHKVVVMCLLIVLITSLTLPSPDNTPYYKSILNLLSLSANQNGINSTNFQDTFTEIQSNSQTVDILYLKIHGDDIYHSQEDTSDWFSNYIIKVDQGQDEIWIDNQRNEQVWAALGITLTTCLLIILSFGNLLISRDFQILVIKPIERMVSLIKKISSMDRGHDSDYGGGDTEDNEFDDDTTNNDTEGDINMSDLENQYPSDTDYSDSIGGFDEEPETNIIVEILSDLAKKKIDNYTKEKNIIDGRNQFNSNLQSLISGIKSWCQRKQYLAEGKIYSKRARIVKEIFTTETTYVNSLKTAIDAFLYPLRTNMIVPLEELNIIFSNIEVLASFNQGFLDKLAEKVNNWSINQSIGDVFSHLDESGDIYSTYVNNYNDAIKTIESLKKDNEKFTEFLLETRESKAKGIDLVAYLIMPVQRCPRYVLLLEDLVKSTPSDHADFANIELAVKNLKKLTVQLNERKRDSENKLAIQDIYMKLVPPVQDILTPGNSVIIQSKLKLDSEKFYFFLFNTGFLKTEKHDNELLVKQYLSIRDNPVQVTSIADVPSMKIFNCFQIKIDDQSLVLFAKTPEKKTEWINAFTQFTKVQTQRTKSMMMMNSSSQLRRSSTSQNSKNSPQLSSSRLSVNSKK